MTGGITVRELGPAETALAHAAMRELRTNWPDEPDFVARVDEVQRGEGYRLVGVFLEGEEHAAAVAGFRTGHNLAWGFHLYVDDLSTRADARRRGLARRLMVWLLDEGRRLGCAELHLDSAVGPARFDAHRLYLSSGLGITAHHFARTLESGQPET
jgi:GNAT superfamily N-acetyltransferase